MGKIGEIRRLILFNLRTLVGFEMLYKSVSTLIFVPSLWKLFDLIMKAGGYRYLTYENILDFLTEPLTLVLLLVLLVLVTTYAMIDIGAVVFTLDQSKQKNHVHLMQILKFSARNAFRAWNPKNFLLIVVLLLLLPFLNIGMASGMLSTISVPEFILDYIEANKVLSALFWTATLFLTVLMIQWLYAFHYFTLEGCSFGEARKKSKELGRKKRFKDFITLLFAQLIYAIVSLLFTLLLITLAVLLGGLFSHITLLNWIAPTLVLMVFVFSVMLIAAMAVPVSYACVSALFYQHKKERGEVVLYSVAPAYSENARKVRWIHWCNLAIGVLVAALSLTFGFLLCSGRIDPQLEFVRNMEITAHRGASVSYPENTMAAFAGAKAQGADWIELDVQQCKDGQIIVIHDSNFYRTTGVNANTWEMTYEEIAALDAGSFFGEEFAGEKIPLLFEVVQFAKENGIKLNIELKPTGHETDFEQTVVDIIRQERMEESCVITSQVYEVLERVKTYDKSITTVYVTSLAYGEINSLTAADHFSVEATSATPDLIARVHNAGKQIYAWTVNTREGINRMIERNVDNIITDNIELAKQCVYASRYSNLLVEYMKLFE